MGYVRTKYSTDQVRRNEARREAASTNAPGAASSTRRVLHNMKDGFCKVAAAPTKYGKYFPAEYQFIPKLRFDRSTAVDGS